MTDDPFVHHPALRDRIGDPLASFFRNMAMATIDAQMAAMGLPTDWHFTEDQIAADHRAFLANLPDDDLWVFAYGSLMWDPGFVFAEVRRARLDGYARRFILKEANGGRGQPDAPGLMAALDSGHGCDGLAFRIARENVAAESWYLWKREMIAPAYKPIFPTVNTALGPVTALTFAADHASPVILPDLTYEEQVRYIATGTGILGTSVAYLEKIASQFEVLGIADDDVTGLLADVRTYVTAQIKPY